MLNPVWPDQVRKHPKNAPGGAILGVTRYENRGKVRLVDRILADQGKKPGKTAPGDILQRIAILSNT